MARRKISDLSPEAAASLVAQYMRNVMPATRERFIKELIRHAKTCEVALGWSSVCDCGAEEYRRSLLEEPQ